jgi:lipopolysaccharide/colanic/teichoic acid biosynthesis glycosyltransferase
MYSHLLKPTLDKLIAMILLALFTPVLLVLFIMIYLQDLRNPLFVQKRVGQYGKTFWMLKIRSMKCSPEGKGSHMTLENDPRITRLGRFIRKTSLDEVPQLVNVLWGQMSLVGPRPDVPEQKDLYTDDEFKKRCSVKPGITGLAQAKLRSAATEQQRKAYDLYYANNVCLSNDLEILLLTAFTVIKGKATN